MNRYLSKETAIFLSTVFWHPVNETPPIAKHAMNMISANRLIFISVYILLKVKLENDVTPPATNWRRY